MTAALFRGRIWIACIAGAGLWADAWGTPPKLIDVTLAAPPQVALRDTILLNIRVTGAGAADFIDVEVKGSGSLQIDQSGRHAPADVVHVEVPIRTLDEENGRLSVVATADTDGGYRIGYARADLFGYRSNGQIFLSPSSLTDAKIRAAAAAGSPVDYSEFSRATAVESNHRLPAEKERYAEEVIDKALGRPPSGARRIQAVAEVTVAGRILWMDGDGNTHALPIATVEVYEEEVLGGDQLLGETTTDALGDYTINVSDDDIFGPDIYIKVLARSSVADIRPDVSSGETYFMRSVTHNDQQDGADLTINLTAGNDFEADQAFGVHHALVAAGAYMNLLNGSAPNQIVTRFPTNAHLSHFIEEGDIHIKLLDAPDWDVIQHEYGHYVMYAYKFENSPGGDHALDENMAEVIGDKSAGIRLAWGEGWATFFAVASQRHLGLASLGIPNVGDLSYQDTLDSNLDISIETSTGLGEDNETSVFATLWDLADSADDGEDVTIPLATLFQIARDRGAVNIGEFWNALTAGVTNDVKAKYGNVFARNLIAPQALTPSDGVPIDSPGVFSWNQNGAGAAYPLDDIRVRFFDGTFNVETFDAVVGNTNSHTFSPSELLGAAGQSGLVRWVVAGRSTTAPSIEYWSNERILGSGASVVFVIDTTGSMGEEIAGVRAGLNAFIDSFEASHPAGLPTMHLLTFKDFVTHVATSSDPAVMRAAVAGLRANEGDSCPESSAHALAAAAPLVADEGMVLLITDASPHPGANVGAAVASMKERGVAVVTIVSGDCASSTFGLSGGDAQTPIVSIQDTVDTGGPPPGPPAAVPVADFVGDTIDTAQEILPGDAVMGTIEEVSDVDTFAIDLVGGTDYTILFESIGSGVLALFDPSGDRIRLNTVGGASLDLNTFDSSSAVTTGPLPATGQYVVSVHSTSQSTYRLLVSDGTDPFAPLIGGVQMYSVISAETGGLFADVRGINSADDTEYVNTIFNALRSTLESAVIRSNIRDVPRGAKITVTLTGRGTNWTSATGVALTKADGSAPAGVTIGNATINSPTSITLALVVAADAELVEVDAAASTPLGGATERSVGVGILRIVTPPAAPTLLGVHPSRLIRGADASLVIQGINTSFAAGAAVTLGNGIVVGSITPISATELKVDVNVSAAARIGYRRVQVTQGTEVLRLDNELLIGSDSLVPALSLLTPSQIRRGQTVSVVATGSGTAFVNGVTTADFGPGITVVSLTVNNPTEAIVELAAAADAAIGFRNITLTTGTNIATRLDGLFVDAGTTTATAPSAVIAPVAAAAEGTTITLDGTQSVDPDGTIATYLWEQTAGPSVAITSPSSNVATFVAPDVAASTLLTFRLTVTDDAGLTSSTSTSVSIDDSTPAPAPAPTPAPTPAPPIAADDSSDGCFIATAAYGSYLDPHVQVLRAFRDEQLLTNAPGRAFVKLYYRYSPPIADAVAKNPVPRALTRLLLTPVVFAVSYPRAGLVFVFLAFAWLTWRRAKPSACRRTPMATIDVEVSNRGA